jgi:hypothetical protein
MTLAQKIERDLQAGKSTDWIIGEYISKRTDKDDILKIIRTTCWTHWKKTGERFKNH